MAAKIFHEESSGSGPLSHANDGTATEEHGIVEADSAAQDDGDTISRRLVLQAFIILVLWFTFMIAVCTGLEGWSVLDSVYFATMTVTTVGYGDHEPFKKDSTKILLSFALVFGVGFVGAGISFIGEALLDKMDGENDVEHSTVHFGILFTPAKKKLLFSFLSFALVVVIGVVGFRTIEPEQYTWVDAYWSTVVTITTVGYGDVVPQSSAGKIFTSIWLFIAVIVVARSMGSVVDYIVEAKMRRALVDRITAPLNLEDIKTADKDGDGLIDKNEFIIWNLLYRKIVDKSTVESIGMVFDRLDVDQSSTLTQQEAISDLRRMDTQIHNALIKHLGEGGMQKAVNDHHRKRKGHGIGMGRHK